jgi:hypothetical protein
LVDRKDDVLAEGLAGKKVDEKVDQKELYLVEMRDKKLVFL